MTRSIRFLLPVAACLVALAFGGTAFAAYDPSLIVAGTNHAVGGSGPVVIGFGQNDNDDATGMVTLYSPRSYGVTLGQAVGTQLGTLSGVIKLAAQGGAKLNVEGTVKADNPASYVSNMCVPGTHEAVWTLEYVVVGNTFSVQLYVDRVTTGPEAAYASARIQVCFPTPYLPPPQGAPQGASVLIAAFSVRGVFKNPSSRGSHAWNGLFAPYTPGTGTLNAANGAQSTSYVKLPVQLAVSAMRQKRGKRTFAFVTACLREMGQGIRGIRLNFLEQAAGRQPRKVGSARTNARGCAKTRVRVKKKAMFVMANANVPPRGAPGCTPTLAPRCSAPSIAPAFDLFSRLIRIRR